MQEALIYAGIPEINAALYRRIRFLVGDPSAVIDLLDSEGQVRESLLILRDIEMARARKHARADRVACPQEFAPLGGLSGDRLTATAQATAEALKRLGVSHVRGHASTPLIFIHFIEAAGIEIDYDPQIGLLAQRCKDEQELRALREAQLATERAMRMACEMVASATPNADGVLELAGDTLTSERVRSEIDVFLLREGYDNPGSIVAGGPQGGDCHQRGTGPLSTEQSVIIDIFPRNKATRYCGDCTRTVVNGQICDELNKMHTAVIEAKVAAIARTRAGVTGQDVHESTAQVIQSHGYAMGMPDGPHDTSIRMVHGTGYGVGLDVHEPPLLDVGGPELLVGDVLTIEPGLYGIEIGGIRVEDMVAVTEDACTNFNTLPEGLTWA